MLTHAVYHFNSSVQRFIDQWQASHALCTFGRKKRGVRDDIKYTWTNLKIGRLCIARTHGWVELAPTVPTSSSHRSSTVQWQWNKYDISFSDPSLQLHNIKSTYKDWQIANSVPRISIWHHKPCRVIQMVISNDRLLFLGSSHKWWIIFSCSSFNSEF